MFDDWQIADSQIARCNLGVTFKRLAFSPIESRGVASHRLPLVDIFALLIFFSFLFAFLLLIFFNSKFAILLLFSSAIH